MNQTEQMLTEKEKMRLRSIKERESTWHFKTMTEPSLGRLITVGFVEGLKLRDEQALAAEPAPNTLGYVQGVEAVAKMLNAKADDYAKEFGFGDMGGLEFSREAQREYHSTLIELAEEVRAMVGAKPTPLVKLTQIERDRIAVSCQSTQQVISAVENALEAKNGAPNA